MFHELYYHDKKLFLQQWIFFLLLNLFLFAKRFLSSLFSQQLAKCLKLFSLELIVWNLLAVCRKIIFKNYSRYLRLLFKYLTSSSSLEARLSWNLCYLCCIRYRQQAVSCFGTGNAGFSLNVSLSLHGFMIGTCVELISSSEKKYSSKKSW